MWFTQVLLDYCSNIRLKAIQQILILLFDLIRCNQSQTGDFDIVPALIEGVDLDAKCHWCI